jgi:AraC-type transcriptional regulator
MFSDSTTMTAQPNVIPMQPDNPSLSRLRDLVEQQWQTHGPESAIDGLRLTHALEPSGTIRALYQTSFYIVLQGAKVTAVGESAFHYRQGECLLASVNVPVNSRIGAENNRHWSRPGKWRVLATRSAMKTRPSSASITASCLARIADRQDLPYVAIRFVPINDTTAVLCIDLPVYWTVWGTSVLDSLVPDSYQDVVELGLAHTKTVVLHGKVSIGLIEVEG